MIVFRQFEQHKLIRSYCIIIWQYILQIGSYCISHDARITTTKLPPSPPPTPATRRRLAAPAVETAMQEHHQTARYLHIVICTVCGIFQIEWGEGQCDAVVVWRSDDVNTAQVVCVVAGEVGGLNDARQWRQCSSTCWEMITERHNISTVINSGDQWND